VQGARRVETDPFEGSASFEAELDYVLRALRRHGVSARDAEDLAQDVFLVMWRRRADFDPGRPLRAWLAGIAFKVAHEHHKRSRRFWPREGLDPRDERPLPDEQVASARARSLVLGALGRLSERQRAILVMHDLDGLGQSLPVDGGAQGAEGVDDVLPCALEGGRVDASGEDASELLDVIAGVGLEGVEQHP